MQKQEEEFDARERIVVVNHSGSTATVHLAELVMWIWRSIPFLAVIALGCAVVVGIYFGVQREESVRVRTSLATSTWNTPKGRMPVGDLAKNLKASVKYQQVWLKSMFARYPGLEGPPPRVEIQAFDNGWIEFEVVATKPQVQRAKNALSIIGQQILISESQLLDLERANATSEIELLERFWSSAVESVGIENNPLIELSITIASLQAKLDSIRLASVKESVDVAPIKEWPWWIYASATFGVVLFGSVSLVGLLYLVGSSR